MNIKDLSKRFSLDDIYTVLNQAIEACDNDKCEYIRLNGTQDKDAILTFNSMKYAFSTLFYKFETLSEEKEKQNENHVKAQR